ncbi:MAG: hypothetical protein RLZZ21_2745 [Planctomycetota bacterium]|jgi:hypothetical protein
MATLFTDGFIADLTADVNAAGVGGCRKGDAVIGVRENNGIGPHNSPRYLYPLEIRAGRFKRRWRSLVTWPRSSWKRDPLRMKQRPVVCPRLANVSIIRLS